MPLTRWPLFAPSIAYLSPTVWFVSKSILQNFKFVTCFIRFNFLLIYRISLPYIQINMASSGTMNKIERAHQRYREGKYAEALGFYTDALSLAKTKSQKIALHSNRAACFLKLHDFKKVRSFIDNYKAEICWIRYKILETSNLDTPTLEPDAFSFQMGTSCWYGSW